jgi:hypothetical protein
MSVRQFAVRCAAINQPASASTRSDDPTGSSSLATEQLRAELTAGGLEEVIVEPDVEGDKLTIRGLAPAESKEAARTLVEDQIYDATLDLLILEPGVWVDESIR